jgi:Flp pilus assembly protein TadG
MIMTAISMLFLLLLVGLCIDVSRIYMVRAELQNAADAAALTAARELNGGTGGIDDAITRANAIVNTRGFNKLGVTVASVEFATALNGTYMNAVDAKAAGTVENVRYVRITTAAATTNILFGVKALGTSHTESRQAVAGLSVEIDGICDFFPAAVGLANPEPSPGTEMTLRFAEGTGNSAIVNDFNYIVLHVPGISGNGEVETALLTAGVATFCKTLGDNIDMTPSSNLGNGGRAAGDGMNTRFDNYVNGYGQNISADKWEKFMPDTNVQEFINHDDYINNRVGKVTPPSIGHRPGQEERRIIVAPIVLPGTYPASTDARIEAWGTFFVKKRMYVEFNGNCEDNPPCGEILVEYVGKAQLGNGSLSCGSGLLTPVLYR